MIGVPPGKLIGFWVLDVDVDPDKGIDGAAALARLEAEHGPLPRTCESRTPRGGRHLLFNWDPARPIMNRRGTLPDGIDVRGDGGYFIVPPSRREDGASYRWENLQDEPVEAPEWLYDLIRLKPERTATAANLRSTGAGEETYARTVLDGAARDVAAAPSGKRNDTLNAVAYRLGRMIARDWLSREEVELRLLAAAHACGLVVDDGEHAARATIQSGIEAGIQEPHGDLKDREQSEPFEPKPNGEAIDEVGIGVSLDDFVAYMPAHSYIFKPTREMWAAASVNARLPKTKVRMDRDGTPITSQHQPGSINTAL